MGSSGEATDQEAMAPSTPAFLGEIGLNLALSRPGYFMLWSCDYLLETYMLLVGARVHEHW